MSKVYIKGKGFVFPTHYESCCRKVKELYYEKGLGLNEIKRLLGFKDAGIVHRYKKMQDCKKAGRRKTKPRYYFY